jgi:hypothetical protein
MEYALSLSRPVYMLLRYINLFLTEQTSQLGLFKLKGDLNMIEAALQLYRLIAETNSDENVEETRLQWQLHMLLVALWRSEVRGGQSINFPTEQASFIWALVSHERYRIPSSVESFLVGLRYGFRCIALHHVRITAEGLSPSTSTFYNPPTPEAQIEVEKPTDAEEPGENGTDGVDIEYEPAETRTLPVMSRDSILERLRNFNPKGIDHDHTPFERTC